MNVHSAPGADEVTDAGGRREQLLDAAGRCFAQGGFHATTVAEISLEAGCSPGLLYRYFAGKEALVAALVEREAARTVAGLTAVRESADLMSALEAATDASVAEWDDARAAGLHVQIVAEAARGSVVREPVRQTYSQVIDALAATLRVGQEAGLVDRTLPAADTARVLVAIVTGLAVLRAAGVAEDAAAPQAITRELLHRVLRPLEVPVRPEGTR